LALFLFKNRPPFPTRMQVDHAPLFSAYDRVEAERVQRAAPRLRAGNALQSFLSRTCDVKTSSGFQRMSLCRFGTFYGVFY
jgi:hypothetical protein